jgi:hypothetical protein
MVGTQMIISIVTGVWIGWAIIVYEDRREATKG